MFFAYNLSLSLYFVIISSVSLFYFYILISCYYFQSKYFLFHSWFKCWHYWIYLLNQPQCFYSSLLWLPVQLFIHFIIPIILIANELDFIVHLHSFDSEHKFLTFYTRILATDWKTYQVGTDWSSYFLLLRLTWFIVFSK